jgi:hypothetical protein
VDGARLRREPRTGARHGRGDHREQRAGRARPPGLIDWNGDYRGGHALDREALSATIASLSRYAGATGGGQLPVPYLPARLGGTTGADATLYIGGWGYLANHHPSAADGVADAIARGLVTVAAVATIGVAAAAVDHHRPEVHAYGSCARSRDAADSLAVTAIDTIAEIAHPDLADDPALPHGGDSQMYLEMTLVDNHTGRAVWHAHQVFPASAVSRHDVGRAASALLATLPRT